MKRNILFCAAALLFASCNLDQYPYSEVAIDDYVKDGNAVNNLVIGTYNGLYDVLYHEWSLTELRSDNARMRVNKSTSADTKLIEQLDQSVIQTAHSWVGNYWDATYATINRANSVLSYLQKVEDPVKRAQYEGEARFVRAHLYFNLARLFGPVFIVTSKTGADEAREMQRSPLEDVYSLIESDLNAIVDGELLPLKHSDADLGRADMKAAKALLAKVYMTRYSAADEKYSKAALLLKNVLDACSNPSSGAALVPYNKIFATDNEMNAEIIFAVRYRSGNVGIGSPFTTLFGPANNAGNVVIGSPKHYNFPSDNLIAAYDASDKRKDVVLQEGYMNKTTGLWVADRFCNKFIDSKMATEYDAECDWPVIRLADVMLLYAEALNEIGGPSDEALTQLNAIRQRAGLPDFTLAELSSKYLFRQAVRKERRLELAMENQRWFDLMRWGTAAQTVNDYIASESFYAAYDYVVNPISDWQVLLPIPISVTNINDQVAQNPGY